MQQTETCYLALLVRFTRAYVGVLFWSHSEETEDEDGDLVSFDSVYDIDNMHEDAITRCKRDCAKFIAENQFTLRGYMQWCKDTLDSEFTPEERIAHDFAFTRNRHGVGFWDRGAGKIGERLTKAAHAFPEIDLVVGDDGKVHII